MQKFIRLTYAGLTDGSLLALIALGLVLVYKSTDVINFAHGEFMVIGGFVGYQLLVWLSPNMNAPLAVILAVVGMVIAAVLFGILLERFVLRPMIGEPVISVIMVTIGLSNVIAAIVGLVWGNNAQRLPIEALPNNLFNESGRFEIPFEGARRPLFLGHENLMLIAVVMLVTIALLIFFQRSKHGIAMRATADDQQAAMSMGISIRVVFAFAWSLAAITAALAGLMIGETSIGVSAQDIPVVGLRAFPVIILGGLDSITGAIVGGLIIGLVETYTGGYIDPSLKEIAPYILLLIVLMIRPYGLFGQEIIERV
ncbi:MAG: branched-chain amino acid ABC transporter permease [Anaerolineae bacterium]|nr:branched-chain amino acid ABC transporter permease [Anaerolineae bacterium]